MTVTLEIKFDTQIRRIKSNSMSNYAMLLFEYRHAGLTHAQAAYHLGMTKDQSSVIRCRLKRDYCFKIRCDHRSMFYLEDIDLDKYTKRQDEAKAKRERIAKGIRDDIFSRAFALMDDGCLA